jgi:hypothetical protein
MRYRSLLIGLLAFVLVGASSFAVYHASAAGQRVMSVRILSPTGPVRVSDGGQIHLKLKITGLTLNPSAMGRKNVPGQGHYHFYVDCIPANAYRSPDLAGCWKGASADPNATFDLSKSPTRVSPGTHVLLIALARNDHILYRVAPAALVFTVIQVPMSIQIVSPTNPVTVKQNGKFPISLKVSGIKLDMAAMGRKNVPGEGHYHFYVDCITANGYVSGLLSGCWAYSAAATKTDFDLKQSHVKIKPGIHLLLVALARNDHVLYPVPAATLVFKVLPK